MINPLSKSFSSLRTPSNKYIPGDNWCNCAICNFDYRASQMRYNPEGLLVCLKDYDPEHPQDIMREYRTEKMLPSKVSPRPTYVYKEIEGLGAGANDDDETLPIVLDWEIDT